MANLRWAVMGTGRIARGVAPKLAAADGCEVVCFASRQRAKADDGARESGLIANLSQGGCTYDEMTRRDDVDAVYLTLINNLHAQWCVRLLESGKHVLCEKPLCASEAQARAIADAAKANGRLCVEGFMYLHHPQSARLRAIAQDPHGPIGKLQSIRCYRDVMMSDPYILATRMSHAMHGGSLMDVGCYPVSLARYLTGEEPGDDLDASCELAEPVAGETGRVDETCRFSWTFPSGVTFEGGCSFASEHRVFVELVGDRGRAVAGYPFSPDLREATPIEVNDEREVWNDRGDKFTLQFEGFARAVREECEMVSSGEWSVGQARVIERLHRMMGVRFGV